MIRAVLFLKDGRKVMGLASRVSVVAVPIPAQPGVKISKGRAEATVTFPVAYARPSHLQVVGGETLYYKEFAREG